MNWMKKLNAGFRYMGLMAKLVVIKEDIIEALKIKSGWSHIINECISPMVMILLPFLHLGHKTGAVVRLFNAIDTLIRDKKALARAEDWFRKTRASGEVREIVAAVKAVRDE